MSVSSFKELIEHVGHKVEVAYYGPSKEEADEVNIECADCNTVLVGFERVPSTCQKCGSDLDDAGYCYDETCPYSDHKQDENFTEG